MDENELIIDEECLPVAVAAVRSPEALADFYSKTTGPLRWTAGFLQDGENRYRNTYDLIRQNAGGAGVIRLTLSESVIIRSGDRGSHEIVIDEPGEQTSAEAFPGDARSNEGLDLLCAFLAQNAEVFHETLVKPYLSAKTVTLEDGRKGVLRDHGILKFVLRTSEDRLDVEEVRLFGIDLAAIEDDPESGVDRAAAFDGYENFLSVRAPAGVAPGRAAVTVAVESAAISERIDTGAFEEPELEEEAPGLEAMEARAAVFDETATLEESDFVPPFYMTSRKVLAQADPIPSPELLERGGGRIRDIQHPDNANACLRLIQLPSRLKANRSAARLLAESGAIQNGDVLLSFRPEWSRTNAYGNVQLGLSHTALALIDPRGAPTVHTLENPIGYSSNLNYSGHYRDLDFIHIVRPALTAGQQLNLRRWAREILTRRQSNINFFGNYGSPFFSRETPHREPLSISERLAQVVTTGSGTIEAFCSEFVWALLGLRDCDPAGYQPNQGMEKAIFDPLTAAEIELLLDPGLVQGPDVSLRQSGLTEGSRRDWMANRVLVDTVTNPSQLVGIMSSGHREAARSNQPKIDQMKAFYNFGEPEAWLGKAWDDDSDPSTNLNFGVIPNYSPTSFFIMPNSDAVNEAGQKLMKYIGTVAYQSV